MPPGETNSLSDACKQVENCAIYCLNKCALSGTQQIIEGNKGCVPQNQMKAFMQLNHIWKEHLFITLSL